MPGKDVPSTMARTGFLLRGLDLDKCPRDIQNHFLIEGSSCLEKSYLSTSPTSPFAMDTLIIYPQQLVKFLHGACVNHISILPDENETLFSKGTHTVIRHVVENGGAMFQFDVRSLLPRLGMVMPKNFDGLLSALRRNKIHFSRGDPKAIRRIIIAGLE